MGFTDLESREVKTERLVALRDRGMRGMFLTAACAPLLTACVQPPQIPAPLSVKKAEQEAGVAPAGSRAGRLVEPVPTPQLIQPPARAPFMTPPSVRPGDEEPSVLNLEQVSIPSYSFEFD